MNILRNDLTFKFDEKPGIIQNKKLGDIFYTGHLWGMVESGNPISKSDTLSMLSVVTSIDELKDHIRYVVGNACFFLSYKNNAYMISSATTAPYYFYQSDEQLYFSVIEGNVCRLAAQQKEKINPFELYDLLKTSRKELTPYGSLIQNIQKIPCGHVCKIDKDFNLNYKSYFNEKPKNNLKNNYANFKKVLESTAKLYVDTSKDIYVYYSAGLDCMTMILALKKYSNDVLPVMSIMDGEFDTNKRQKAYVSKKFFNINPELIMVDRYSKSQRSMMKELCKLTSSNNGRWSYFVFWSIMEKYKNKKAKDSIFTTGHIFDSAYGINFTKNPPFDPQGLIGRYFYSRMYQKKLNGFFNRKLREKFVKNKDLDAKTEYLYAMADPSQYLSHNLPIIKDRSIFSNKDFFKKYLSYKKEKYIDSALSNEKEISLLSAKELNKKFRILRHYESALLHFRNGAAKDYFSGQNTSFLPGEGPILDFTFDVQLGWRDVFLAKRFLHKYVREKTNESFTMHFRAGPVLGIFKKLFKEYSLTPDLISKKDTSNMSISSKSERDRFLFSTVFLDEFFDRVDLDKPTVLAYLDNKYVQNFVKQYYTTAKKGLLNHDQVMDIYNLETFIQDLDKK